MELREAVARRRMVRAFTEEPVAADVVGRVLRAGLRAPSAGWSQGFAFVSVEGTEAVGQFWDRVRPDWRDRRRPPDEYNAPVVILPLADRQAYLDRYSQPDKARFGLGRAEAWPVPYWHIDTAMAAMLMLLTAVDEGLGALFVGIFTGEAELLADLGVPTGLKPIGAVVLGHPHPGDRFSSRPSHDRRRPENETIHRGRWGGSGPPRP